MAKICWNCGKKINPLVYSAKMNIHGVEGEFCNKCSDTFEPLMRQIDTISNVRDYENTLDRINYLFENNLCNQELKDYIIEELEDKLKLNGWEEKILEYREEKKEKEENEKRKKEIDVAYKQLSRNFKTTTGYDFQGYVIENYLGIVSGEVVLGTGFISEFTANLSDLFGTYSNTFSEKMRSVKEEALNVLTKNAMMKGANAIIGVDFDYLTFSNNILGVSANGTAVVIKKIDEGN